MSKLLPHPTPARRRAGVPLLTLGALIASSLTLTAAPPAQAAETLLSQGRTATASSYEGEAYRASAAVDGDLTGTRWASQWSDPQWIQVDLGSEQNVSRVVLTWEAAHAENYELQVSDNGTDWHTLKTCFSSASKSAQTSRMISSVRVSMTSVNACRRYFVTKTK